MRPSQAILALETLRNLSSVPIRRNGVELTFDDSQTVKDVYQQWLLLLIDLGYLRPDEILRTGRRLWSDLNHADVLVLNNLFSECLHLIRMQSIKGFKVLCKGISTHFYNLIKMDLLLIPQGDVYAAKRLIQVLSYTSRLTLKDINLTAQMLDEYLAIEDSISDDLPIHLVRNLNTIIRRWMKTFDPSDLLSSHGPGGIAEHKRASLETKYKTLSTDQRLKYAFGDPWWCDPTQVLSRVSKTIFVPKSYKTFRTISMEPTTLMYFQQGVWKEIDRLVCSHDYLRSRLDFHNQERNKTLAKIGSIERNYATIDLSAASDSVSYKLVKALFRGTRLSRFIVATRSTSTLLPNGRTVVLKKFAPMGSALCFPIESIIFASVCELVTREFRLHQKYSVFGDDIIVPTQCVENTMSILNRLGFRVNREKSFYHSTCWFRESCGGEYCDGFDVTPMRVSRKYSSLGRGIRLEALIESSNLAYKKGFRFLRSFFLLEIKRTGFVALFSPTSLLADNYTNYHTDHRWNRSLQCLEVKVSDLSKRHKKADLRKQDETIRYRHWLETTHSRKIPDDGFVSVVCRPTESFHEVWRQKPYETSDQGLIDYYVLRQRLLDQSL